MNDLKLLLCTDMDRTVIPNGSQPEHPDAPAIFHKLCNLPGVRLVYVTGRNLELVVDAIDRFDLPTPSHLITDVGTKIYKNGGSSFDEVSAWQEKIAIDWSGKSHEDLKILLKDIPNLRLQEERKQNTFKLSYYLPLTADVDGISETISKILSKHDVSASLISSIDEPEQTALLDILPRNATKLHGLNFLREYLGYSEQETIFAGDSGNDLPVLVSSVRSILVANADQNIRKRARDLAAENGNLDVFYQAENKNFPSGGNYSAGVVQGVIHYMPEFAGLLEKG